MHYVEWGLLCEIGDLYVLPKQRGRGVAAILVRAQSIGATRMVAPGYRSSSCPQGEEHRLLSRFYKRLGFESTGRMIMSKRLQRD
jgi:GNAT superfamily N-acetyltransferase